MSNTSLAGRSILIVEDELVIAMDLERLVHEADGTVIGPTPSVDYALRLLASGQKIDAALLDVSLHGGKSYPVADQLGEQGIPFIFLTGQVDAIPSRFDHVTRIAKPASSSGVIAALRLCLT